MNFLSENVLSIEILFAVLIFMLCFYTYIVITSRRSNEQTDDFIPIDEQHVPGHPAVSAVASHVRSLQNMIGANASVLYAQAVLRPSLALAQGHALALIQGVDVEVTEWTVASDVETFPKMLSEMILELRELGDKKGWRVSVERGDTLVNGVRKPETLRISVRDDYGVLAIVLFAAGTMLMHDIADVSGSEIVHAPEIFKIVNEFALKCAPAQKGYINIATIVEGKVKLIRTEVKDNGVIHDSFYPQLKEGATNFIDRYLASSSSILNLYGRGGSGKSTLMAKAAARSNGRTVIMVDNPAIYMDHGLASQLLNEIRAACNDGGKVLVLLEEVDAFIKAKTMDNSFLVQLLSVSSGVVKLDVKFITCSNLTNVDKILDVLNRAGRSFGSVEFINLTPDEANAARASLGLEACHFDGDVTLADAICEKVTHVGSEKVHMGFTTA